MFHALTGCNSTSAYRGKRQEICMAAYDEVTNTFMFLASHPFEHLHEDSIHFHNIERFAVILYDKTSSLSSVNEARDVLNTIFSVLG